ncbi:4,5-DOPA dioxygenase extradiol [Taibaiella soli]|uniref:4,5-DOPA dioxygenase extradiol n=2 Tax=Taibaiella soli TaxID=1649169 RepID=A0A2W2BUF1_9BACT|nr:4,5-DOPA dioxygenase extradiol [Taibaiella soli]
MKLNELKNWADKQDATDKMPVLFVGHGNPMNAILDNPFSRKWTELGKELPRPKAILTISAHWLTRGTHVTAMKMPKTIHDFGGFPKALFDQQYPAPGSPELAKEVQKLVTATEVQEDFEWGLDHGTWSVLKPMFPEADIPVFQLSIDYYKSPQWHYDLAKQLSELRRKGVLIMGSGNIVHNLRMVDFQNRTNYDWAAEFDSKIKSFIDSGNHQGIINYDQLGTVAKMAVPTNDHYLPMLYSMALQDKKDEISYFNEQMDVGSISMRSLLIA